METVQHKNVLLFIAAIVLGYASWVVPGMLIPGKDDMTLPFSPVVMTNRDQAEFCTIISLTVSGFVLGLFDAKHGAIWGAVTGLPITVLSFVEGALLIAPHNLYPIEFIIYVIFTLPAVLGGVLGSFIRRKISTKLINSPKT